MIERSDTVGLQEIVKKGAAIGGGPIPTSVVVARAEVIADGKMLWCTPFPEQQHIHLVKYDSEEEIGDIAIAYRKGKLLQAYIAVLPEWPNVPNEDAVRQLENWEDYLSGSPERQEAFDKFFNDTKYFYMGAKNDDT